MNIKNIIFFILKMIVKNWFYKKDLKEIAFFKFSSNGGNVFLGCLSIGHHSDLANNLWESTADTGKIEDTNEDGDGNADQQLENNESNIEFPGFKFSDFFV